MKNFILTYFLSFPFLYCLYVVFLHGYGNVFKRWILQYKILPVNTEYWLLWQCVLLLYHSLFFSFHSLSEITATTVSNFIIADKISWKSMPFIKAETTAITIQRVVIPRLTSSRILSPVTCTCLSTIEIRLGWHSGVRELEPTVCR